MTKYFLMSLELPRNILKIFICVCLDGFSSGAVGGGVGSGTGSSGNGIGGSTTGGGGALKSVIQHISKSIYCSAVNIFTDQGYINSHPIFESKYF